MLWKRHLLKKIQDTRNIVQRTRTPQSPILPNAISCPVIFSWISATVWNLFPFKGDLSFGKAKSHRAPTLSWGDLSHLGDLMFCQKTLHKMWCMSRYVARLWWSCQSPVAHSCSLLSPPNSFHRGMSKLNAKLDADSLLYSLNHFEWDGHTVNTHSLNSIYHPHLLVQWSHHCSHVCIPIHFPWLPGYINVMQTLFVVLTMAGLFTDRPHIYMYCFFGKQIYNAQLLYFLWVLLSLRSFW